MDDMDEFEEEMHKVLDSLNLEPNLVEMMRALWLLQIEIERQRRGLH